MSSSDTIAAPISLVGQTLAGRYELLEPLGEGTLFASFQAQDKEQPRLVTLKTLLPAHADNTEIITTLRDGIGQVLSLNHVGIARPLDVGSDSAHGAALFLAEEYVRGMDLRERIRRGAPFSQTVAVEVAIAIADALAFAANRGIFHGDLRPSHVLAGAEGPIKINGWGVSTAQTVAASEDPELLKSAAPYSAPEFWATGTPTAAADLYSLGIILYEMLTAGLPFIGDSPLQIAHRHAEEPVPSPKAMTPSVPRALDGITQKLLAKRPSARYASATELLTDLRAVRDALRFGKSLAWSPLDVESPSRTTETPRLTPEEVRALFNDAGTAVMPTGPIGLEKSKRNGNATNKTVPATPITPVTVVAAPTVPPVEELGTVIPPPPGPVIPAPAPTPPVESVVESDPPTIVARSLPQEQYYVITDDDEIDDDSEEEKTVSATLPARKGHSFNWLLPLNLLLATIFVATFGYVVKLTFLALDVPTDVVVPNLVGKSLTEAKTIGIERKFQVDVVGDQFSDKYPIDTIYQMRPEPGRHIRENKKVTVWVSKGPRMVFVPDVRDVAFEKARAQLEKIGLRVGDKRYEWDELIAKGNVVDQIPPADENRPRGTRVDLVLSKGPQPVVEESPAPILPLDNPTPDATTDTTDDGSRHSLTVKYVVPDDANTHNIRIDVTDQDGSRTIYTKSHQAGEVAMIDVEGVGKKITFIVYDNDEKVNEITGPPFKEKKSQ